MQKHVLGETGNILLTAGGNFQIKVISEIKGTALVDSR
jgi:hypothetical protein